MWSKSKLSRQTYSERLGRGAKQTISYVQAGKQQLEALQDQMHEGAELTAQLQGKLAFEQTVAKVASFTLTPVAPG